MLLSSRKVIILEDPRGRNYKSLSLSSILEPWQHQWFYWQCLNLSENSKKVSYCRELKHRTANFRIKVNKDHVADIILSSYIVHVCIFILHSCWFFTARQIAYKFPCILCVYVWLILYQLQKVREITTHGMCNLEIVPSAAHRVADRCCTSSFLFFIDFISVILS